MGTLLLAGLFALAPAATAVADEPDPGPLGGLLPPDEPTPPSEMPPETAPEEPAPAPGDGVPILRVGDEGRAVKVLQVRLQRVGVRDVPVTGVYGKETVTSVKAFQKQAGYARSGQVDQATLTALKDETGDVDREDIAAGMNRPYGKRLPASCLVGHRVLCVDKAGRNVRWVVDGKVKMKLDARFGGEETPTREGIFSVTRKSRDHISSLYDTAMPFAMFFDRGQAVHYSPDFATRGYYGRSHGCVNIRDYAQIRKLFDKTKLGDRVVVYRSRAPIEDSKDSKDSKDKTQD